MFEDIPAGKIIYNDGCWFPQSPFFWPYKFSKPQINHLPKFLGFLIPGQCREIASRNKNNSTLAQLKNS